MASELHSWFAEASVFQYYFIEVLGGHVCSRILILCRIKRDAVLQMDMWKSPSVSYLVTKKDQQEVLRIGKHFHAMHDHLLTSVSQGVHFLCQVSPVVLLLKKSLREKFTKSILQ